MPKSSFTKYLAFLLFANLLIKPIYIFGIETQAQNLLGPNSWGLYFGLLNFCFLFQIILDPGIHNQNTKWVAENRGNLSVRIGQTIIMKLYLGLLFLVVLGAVGTWIGYPVSYFKLLGMIALNFFLGSFYVFLKSHFPAMGDYGKETLFSVLDKILLIVILGVQIYVLKDLSIESFVLSITVANVIAIIIAFTRVRKITKLDFYFSIRDAFSILKESFGFALVGLFMSLFNRMDGVMLERMLGDEAYASGVYAAGYRILDAANMFALLFASLLLPMFAYRLHKDGEVGQLAEDLDLSYRAQLKGWEIMFLEDVLAPAELPAEMHGLKSQQFRWMKGGAETARKILPTIWKSDLSLGEKFHASSHLLSSSVFLFIFIIGVFSVPLIYFMGKINLNLDALAFFMISLLSIIIIYFVANVQTAWTGDSMFKKIIKFIFLFPVFLSLSMGLSLHNSIAVLQGYRGKKSAFIRTPKFNIVSLQDKFNKGKYRKTKISFATIMEGLLSIYFLLAVIGAIYTGNTSLIVYHLALSIGFGTIFYYSIRHLQNS